jgi:hypothetical protein
MKHLFKFLLLLVLIQTGTQAQESKPAELIILGTFHFANPGLDVAQFEAINILSETKQKEVLEVVASLAAFNPTKIAIERGESKGQGIDSLYAAYRGGNYELGSGEDEQLGFRLASEFDHNSLYFIDEPGDFPIDKVLDYANQHDTLFLEYFHQFISKVEEQMDSIQKVASVGEMLKFENDPDRISWGHSFYLTIAGVGAKENKVGASLLSAWYDRNIRIFANLKAMAEPGDRIIVIIGAGHAAILRALVEADAKLKLVDPLDYLRLN